MLKYGVGIIKPKYSLQSSLAKYLFSKPIFIIVLSVCDVLAGFDQGLHSLYATSAPDGDVPKGKTS